MRYTLVCVTMYVVEFCLIIFILGKPAASQSCREYSQSCSDDKACCGGCCMGGICRDTYADCRVKSDPCLEELCPPDQECYIFYPIDCPGCGPTKQCRDVPPPPEIHTSTEPAKAAINSSISPSFENYIVLLLLLVPTHFIISIDAN